MARLLLTGVGVWVLSLATAARRAVPDVRRALLDLPVGEEMLARDLTPLQGGGGPFAFRFADAAGDPALAAAREARLGLLVAAVVAAEDARFFEHRGIDPVAMGRAAWANLRAGEIVQGASTVTQQVARTAFATEIGRERTVTRKVRESFLALRLRRALSPEEELEAWLTWVPLGPGAPGILPAANRLFGKPPWDLDLPQLALLAGLAQGPNRYDPLRRPEAAKGRRDIILRRMGRLGLISERARAAAVAAPLGLSPPPAPGRAPGFVAQARRHLAPGTGPVVSTLDPNLQQAALAAVCFAAWEAGARAGSVGELEGMALVAIEPATGAVRAYVPHPHMSGITYPEGSGGSPGGALDCLDEGLEPAPGQLFDFAQAARQPGSAVKPFVLAAGLEAGVTAPDEPVWDGPVAFWTGEEVWEPKNHDNTWAGTIGWVEAMAKSSNPAAAALADRVGMEGVAETFAALGISSPVRPYLSSALGASEATLFEMVAAYAALAGDGARHPPRWTEGRLGEDGTLRPAAAAPAERALAPFTARSVISILGDALPQGTGARALACDPALPAAAGPCLLDWVPEARERGPRGGAVRVFGKSGTSQNNRDGWFVGCVPTLCAGVWMGTPEGGGSLSGGQLPALAWNLFMRRAAPHLPWIHFPAPPPVLSAPTLTLGERAYDATPP